MIFLILNFLIFVVHIRDLVTDLFFNFVDEINSISRIILKILYEFKANEVLKTIACR